MAKKKDSKKLQCCILIWFQELKLNWNVAYKFIDNISEEDEAFYQKEELKESLQKLQHTFFDRPYFFKHGTNETYWKRPDDADYWQISTGVDGNKINMIIAAEKRGQNEHDSNHLLGQLTDVFSHAETEDTEGTHLNILDLVGFQQGITLS